MVQGGSRRGGFCRVLGRGGDVWATAGWADSCPLGRRAAPVGEGRRRLAGAAAPYNAAVRGRREREGLARAVLKTLKLASRRAWWQRKGDAVTKLGDHPAEGVASGRERADDEGDLECGLVDWDAWLDEGQWVRGRREEYGGRRDAMGAALVMAGHHATDGKGPPMRDVRTGARAAGERTDGGAKSVAAFH